MQNWSEFDEEQILTATVHLHRMEIEKKEKLQPLPSRKYSSTEFYSHFTRFGFICGRKWTEIKQFPK